MKSNPVHEWARKQPALTTAQKHDAEEFALLSNAFAFKLFPAVAAGDKNLMVSPVSVSMVLAMIANGAKGEKQVHVLKALNMSGSTKPLNDSVWALMTGMLSPKDAPIVISNAVWLVEPAKPDTTFVATIENRFGGKVSEVSPDAGADQINKWVSSATSGMIEKVLDSLNRDDVVVLVNATAFVDSWAQQFDPDKTKPGDFELSNGKRVTANFMHLEKSSFPYASNKDAECLALPYESGDYSMVLMLPTSGTPEAYIAMQTWESWGELLGSLTARKVDIEIPKLTFKNHIDLKDVVRHLKLEPLLGGDFSGFSPSASGVFLSKILHDTYVTIDEKGTKAAASTTAVYTKSISRTPSFEANRPFAFAIVHKPTGAILFLGVCNDPTKV